MPSKKSQKVVNFYSKEAYMSYVIILSHLYKVVYTYKILKINI